MPPKFPPAIRYLLELGGGTLPLAVTDPQAITHVRALMAAGLVEAAIPPTSTDRATFGHQSPVTVLALTRHGRVEIERLKKLGFRS